MVFAYGVFTPSGMSVQLRSGSRVHGQRAVVFKLVSARGWHKVFRSSRVHRFSAGWSAARGLSLLPATSSQVAEAHHLLVLFIPEAEGQCLQAGEQCDRFHGLEQRYRLMAFLQVVVGNPRSQVMNVMKPYAAGEPLQDLGQLVEGTAFQRRCHVIPVLAALPVNTFKLVLDVKEPHTSGAGDDQNSQLEDQVGFPTE